MPSLNIKDYGLVALGLVVAVLLYLNSNLKDDIEGLNDDIDKLKTSKALCQANNVTLATSINSQNTKIDKYKLDIKQAQKEIEELKSQPVEVRYRTIYKYINREASNECKDIKSMLDGISSYKP